MELIQIENEIEQARLEEQAEDSVKGFGTPKSSKRLGMGLTTTHSCERENLSKTPEYLKSARRERAPYYDFQPSERKESKLLDARRQTSIKNETNPGHLHPSLFEENYIPNGAEQLHRERQDQRESLILMAETIGTSIRKGFEMPKRDCLMFNGNPMNYPRFIENFRINIEDREPNSRVRLAYLIQFCTSTAKEAISNCVILPEEEGYQKAKEILHNLFGQTHIIVCAYINKVTKGGIIKDGEGDKLLELARDMENCQINLNQLGCESEINAQSNLEKIVSRLPRYLQAEWAKEAFSILEKNKVPTFADLTKYIIAKARLANSAFGQLIGSKPYDDKQQKQKRTPKGASFATRGEWKTLNCYYCKKPGHMVEKCYSFCNQNSEARKDVVRKERLCNVCLCKGHFANQCRRKEHCLVAECGQRHHSLLHPVQSSIEKEIKVDKGEEKEGDRVPNETGNNHCISTGAGSPGVRLQVIPVKVRGIDGTREIETYALLDDGSDVSLCDDYIVKQLGISGVPTTFSLTTVNEGAKENHGEEVRLFVSDLNGEEEVDITRAWTVNQLPISNRSIPKPDDAAEWTHLRGIDFPELKNERVRIIIGSDVPEAHWVLEQRFGERKELYAVKTLLGWTLMGPTGVKATREFQVNFIQNQDNILHKQVERLMQLDFSENDHHFGKGMLLEDQRALSIMESSVKKVGNHYELALPWRNGKPALPNNRKMVEKRLASLQNRLKKDPDLREKYRNVIEDYLEKGFAAVVTKENLASTNKDKESLGKIWYLPHHPVLHPQKPDKVRVVFDCAAKFKNTSLNDQLLQGPDLNNTLFGVLLRFRQERIALISDVEGMFHQVRVKPDDSNSLRFLWWPNADFTRPPEEHSMLVHLFGATSSPSCASFALQKTAEDNKDDFDNETIETVKRNFYVDDCLKSVSSVGRAKELAKQLWELLAKGGFNLTKWVSNSREVMASIPSSERAPKMVDLDVESFPDIVALGVSWNIETDTFYFRIRNENSANTRRKLLSFISSLYDPIGIASPFILPGKQILQRLCQINYEWDDEIDEKELKEWESWIQSLSQLSKIAILRCLKLNLDDEVQNVQLHSFSDASRLGYGTVSYLRLVDVNGKINVAFLIGKSRVTPTKQVTIPRLELTAAVLAAKLSRQVEEELEIPIESSTFWTDSTVVLQYITNESTRFQTFVANRLAIIHDLSKPSQWRYVETNRNPADSASRGIKSEETKKAEEWFNGPAFLRDEESTWPTHPEEIKCMPNEHLEWRKNAQVNEILAKKQRYTMDDFIGYYSSWYA